MTYKPGHVHFYVTPTHIDVKAVLDGEVPDLIGPFFTLPDWQKVLNAVNPVEGVKWFVHVA